MTIFTEKELHDHADDIARIVTIVDSDQRHELYTMVALKLQQRLQNYQAVHFALASRRERGLS